MANPYPADVADSGGNVRLSGAITFTDANNQPGGGSALPAEWTVGSEGELEIAATVGSGNTVKVFRLVDPGNPDTDIAFSLADVGGGDENVTFSLAPSGDGIVSTVLVDDNSDGIVLLSTSITNLISLRSGTTGTVLIVRVGNQVVFEVEADGSLHGKTGASLTFDR